MKDNFSLKLIKFFYSRIFGFFLLSMLFSISGCMHYTAHHIAESIEKSTHLPYEEVKSSWKELDEQTGRVVIYIPNRSATEMVFFQTEMSSCDITCDDNKKINLRFNFFHYADLQQGIHTILFNERSSLFNESVGNVIKKSMTVDVKPGEIIYIKIQQSSAGDPVSIVPADIANNDLKELLLQSRDKKNIAFNLL